MEIVAQQPGVRRALPDDQEQRGDDPQQGADQRVREPRRALRAPEPGVEIVGQQSGVRIALGGVGGQGFQADPIERGGDGVVDRAWGGQRVAQLRLDYPGGGLAREIGRTLATEQLEEDHTQAVDIAPLVGQVAPAAGLLGAHVGRRPQDGAVAGQVRLEVGPPRQAEVGQPGPPLLVDEHVRRLQVAVEHPLAVRMVERLGQVEEDPDRGGQVERLLVALPQQRPASDILIGDPALSGVVARVVDRDDVRVVEPGGRSRLAEEPLHDPLVPSRRLEHLQGDIPVEPGVVRQIDLAEAAIPQPLAELEPAKRAQRPLAPGLDPGGRLARRWLGRGVSPVAGDRLPVVTLAVDRLPAERTGLR